MTASSFEFATAGSVRFGAGKARELAAFLGALRVTRVFLTSGQNPLRSAQVERELEQTGIAYTRFVVAHEPTIARVREGTAACADFRAEAVVAVGGGSVIDAAKAIAALVANGGDALDYLEVIGRGRTLTRPSLPFVALPTTAGTGAEVTRNAVLSAPEHGVKASLRSPFMLPTLAIVDPDFLCDAPKDVLRASGLDALSQLIEPFVSVKANPITDALAREGLVRSRRSLEKAVREGAGAAEREDLALASLLGGMCLANAGLGAVHGFAAPAGGMYAAPHGAVCAALLPHVLAVNLRALAARAPGSALLERYRELAVLLTADTQARPEDGVRWVNALCEALAVPPLSAYGMRRADVTQLVDNAARANSMKGNSIVLTPAELTEIALRAL